MLRRSLPLLGAAASLLIAGRADAAELAPTCDTASLITAVTTATTNNEDDTITLPQNCIYEFDAGVAGTLGHVAIPELVSDGGHKITIVGNHSMLRRKSTAATNFRLMAIAGGNVAITRLALTQGFSENVATTDGGAIRVQTGTLEGTELSITNSTANPNGGFGGGIAVKSGATALLHRCGFFSNQANIGGALYNEGGTLRVDNSTFVDNHAIDDGGAFVSNGSTALTSFFNSTIAKNTADFNSANAGSGGGLMNLSGSVSLTNTIVALNNDSSPAGGEVFADVKGAFTDGGHNIIGVTNGSTGFTVSTLVGTAAAPFDPGLGSAAIRDGDTGSYSLDADSPAVNAGDDAVCAAVPVSGVDQRGKSRPAQHCDIGSFELESTIKATLVAEPTTAALGAIVTLTCSVTITPPGPVADSDFQFVEGATTLTTAHLDGDGKAVATLTDLPAGSHDITCVYPGDTTFAAATSDPVTVVIEAPDASVPLDSGVPGSGPPPPSTPTGSGSANADGGTTVPATDDSGCGCRMTPSSRVPAYGLVALGLLALRRRRRF